MKKLRLTQREQQALERFVYQVREMLGKNISSIRLYGSKARGDFHKDSDIDVAILVKRVDYKMKSEVSNIAFEIGLQYNVFISPRVLPVHFLTARIWRITPFIKNLKADSIAL